MLRRRDAPALIPMRMGIWMKPVKKSAELPGGLLVSNSPSARRLRADSQKGGDTVEADEEIRRASGWSTYV